MAQNLTELSKGARRAKQTVNAIKSAGFPVQIDKASIDSMVKMLAAAIEDAVTRVAAEASGGEIIIPEPLSIEDLRSAFSEAVSQLKIDVPPAPPAKEREPITKYTIDNIVTDRSGNILSADIVPIKGMSK